MLTSNALEKLLKKKKTPPPTKLQPQTQEKIEQETYPPF